MSNNNNNNNNSLGGYDYVDVDNITNLLKCFKCKQVLDHMDWAHTACGATLCEDCVDYMEEDGHGCCDDKENNRWINITQRVRNEIDNLMLYCPNKGRGCQETMSRCLLNDHLINHCEFSVLCKKCYKYTKSDAAESHKTNHCLKRNVMCAYCERNGVYEDISKHENNLVLCVKGINNLINHPLITANGRVKKRQLTDEDLQELEEEREVGALDLEDFIVDDDYVDPKFDKHRNKKNKKNKKNKTK